MSSKLTFVLLSWFVYVSTVPMAVYKNAQFNVTNAGYQLANLFPITTQNNCACRCYVLSSCVTGTYFGFNRTCTLFGVQLQQGNLSHTTPNNLTNVFNFPNKTIPFSKLTRSINLIPFCLINFVLVPCHLCTDSSYSNSCSSIVFSNMNCTISAICRNNANLLVSSSITLTSGIGNGCNLGNKNGILTCGSFCN